MRVADVDALRRLDQERHRIDPEPRDAELSQYPIVFAISSRTAGLAMFRSGWCR